MIGWKLLYGRQYWMCPLTVALRQDGLAPGQHRPPEGEAPVVVDGVICLSQQYEVRHGGVHSHAGQAREDDPLVEEVLTAPVQVVTGHQEQAVRVLRQEVLYAVKEELAADFLALVPVLDPVDVVRPPDVETETWSVSDDVTLYGRDRLTSQRLSPCPPWPGAPSDTAGQSPPRRSSAGGGTSSSPRRCSAPPVQS